MNNPLISIIVPIYNVEKYLDKCIDSIVNQTYKNLEIILVNDGSKDKSGDICNEWKSKDRRIKVIHKENTGAGDSRNIALDIAKGDYISFVDSDDYLSYDMYTVMMSFFDKDIDIVECDYISTIDENIQFQQITFKKKVYSTQEALVENINDSIFKQVIWNKIYKKRVINKVRFPTDKKIDDEFFTYKVISNAKKLVHTNAKLYAYRIQNDSVMHSLNINNRFQGIEAKLERQEFLKSNYPALQKEGALNLCFSCIYLAQLCLLESSKTSEKILYKLKLIINKYSNFTLKDSGLKNIIWLNLSKKSLKLTCLIRNKLKIGL